MGNTIAWYILAALTAVGASVAFVLRPEWLLYPGIAAAVLWWLAKRDWWQRTYTLTLLLMVGATSTIAPIVAVAEYGRYVAAAALVAVTWATTRKTEPVINGKLHRRTLNMLWFTVALAAASILWSVDRALSAQQVIALAMLVSLIHMLSTKRWANRERMLSDFRVMLDVLTLVFLLCIAAALVGFAAAYSFGGTEDTTGRFQGIFNNPNMLAILAAISIPLAWGMFKEDRNLFRLASALPSVAVLLLTESRTAMVATGAALAWMVLRSGGVGIAKVAYAGLIGLIVILATGSDLLSDAFSRFGSREGGDALNTRGDAWIAAIELVKDEPLGYGWMAGETLFQSMLGAEDFGFTQTSVHNSYLQYVLELGVLGLIPIIYLTVALVIIAMRGKNKGLESGFVGVAVAGLLVHIAESAMFGTGQAYPYVFWFAMAAALAVYQPRPDKKQPLDSDAERKKLLPDAYRHMKFPATK